MITGQFQMTLASQAYMFSWNVRQEICLKQSCAIGTFEHILFFVCFHEILGKKHPHMAI